MTNTNVYAVYYDLREYEIRVVPSDQVYEPTGTQFVDKATDRNFLVDCAKAGTTVEGLQELVAEAEKERQAEPDNKIALKPVEYVRDYLIAHLRSPDAVSEIIKEGRTFLTTSLC